MQLIIDSLTIVDACFVQFLRQEFLYPTEIGVDAVVDNRSCRSWFHIGLNLVFVIKLERNSTVVFVCTSTSFIIDFIILFHLSVSAKLYSILNSAKRC